MKAPLVPLLVARVGCVGSTVWVGVRRVGSIEGPGLPMRALRVWLDRARRLLASLLCCQDTNLNFTKLGALSSPMSDPHLGNRWGQSNNFRTFCPGRFNTSRTVGVRRGGGIPTCTHIYRTVGDVE